VAGGQRGLIPDRHRDRQQATIEVAGNRHVMTGVATGAQSYAIGGTIGCPTLGQCQATGGGVVDVAPGRSFEVQWQNTAFAMCEVVLVG
ncbi:MAG: hypothetical protein AAGK32_12760, partial [Actinomycetota bacterium]